MSDLVGFFDALLRCEITLWNLLDDAVQQAHGVSFGRLQALRMLSARGEQARVQDLAGDLHITVGATSKLVDRLEADGTALRGPNPHDRRSSLISVTAAGSVLLEAGMATVAEVLAANVPEHQETGAGLGDLTSALGRLGGQLHETAAR